MEKEAMKTGTTTVGLVCRDGVVLAADKRATAGYMVASKKIEKIQIISEDVALTMAGLVSDAQLLIKIIKAQINLETFRKGKKASVKEIASLLSSLVYGNIRKFSSVPGIVGFLLGGKDKVGFHLYDIGIDGSTTKHDDYVADGSGMQFAIGVLESSYTKNLSINEGIKLAVKTVNTAIQRDIATGNGIDVVTITKEGAKKVLEKEISANISM